MACYWAVMQQPPHLTAIVPYEALTDVYGDVCRQGGLWHSGFQKHWFNNTVIPTQYGRLEGLSEDQLAKQRFDYNELATRWVWRSEGPWPVFNRVRDLAKIKVPMLTAGNWMDSEIHLPGNPTSFERASSTWKFLEMHTGNHLAAYYEEDQIQKQLQFLDFFLKDKKNNGLKNSPRIDLLIRRGMKGFHRTEGAWPPKDAMMLCLTRVLQASIPLRQSLSKKKLEILGFPHLDLTVSTDTKDMDIFVCFYVLDPNGEMLEFRGNHDEPAISFLRSWFRLSHRTLSSKSTPYRPMLDQMKPASVEANKSYDINIPVVCTSMIIEPGHRLAIALRANDEEIIPPMRHIGPDRPEGLLAGINRIRFGGKLLLPAVRRP
ncbi:alpha/beta-hydrolase [Lizonia empirigonia]|nr:alpha/beta-hydrolase [Lizonia empirigonia]